MSDTASALLAATILLGFFVIVFLLVRALIAYVTWPKCPRCGAPRVWNTSVRDYRRCKCWREVN